MQFPESLMVAKRRGVPLVMVETSDAAVVCNLVRKEVEKVGKDWPIIRWDMVMGVAPVNNQGQEVCSMLAPDPLLVARPDELLQKLPNVKEDTIILCCGAEKVIGEAYVRQGIWNLRDPFKATGRMLVLLVPIGTKIGADLKDDVVVLDHALPDAARLQKVAVSVIEDAGIPPLTEDVLRRTVDATLGISEFAAEQSISMSLSKKSGVDLEELWARKCKTIEQTNGLTVYKGKDRFDAIGGNANAKNFFKRLVSGKRPPRVVVFIDEIEKAIGTQQDTSGTSQSMLGTLLSWMEDKDVTGTLLIGVAGSGKSAICKAIGNEAGCPTVQFDLSGMKGGIVGSSEQNLRAALATVDAIGQGEILVVATCNSMANMPPELKRRFKFSTMFFDLPTDDERNAIWSIYLKKFGLNCERPNDAGWTGAEIKTCCQIADRLGLTLKEASAYIVPVAKSGATAIEALRREANGSYVSASYSGAYVYTGTAAPAPVSGGRKIEA